METERFFCSRYDLKKGNQVAGVMWCLFTLLPIFTVPYLIITGRRNYSIQVFTGISMLSWFTTHEFLKWVWFKYDDDYFWRWYVIYAVVLFSSFSAFFGFSFADGIDWFFYFWIPPYLVWIYLFFASTKRYENIRAARRYRFVMGDGDRLVIGEVVD